MNAKCPNEQLQLPITMFYKQQKIALHANKRRTPSFWQVSMDGHKRLRSTV